MFWGCFGGYVPLFWRILYFFILEKFEILYRCYSYYSESQRAKKTFTARVLLVGALCNILRLYGYISQYLKERKTFPWNFLQISWYYCVKCGESHCVISVRIQSYSGLCFFAFVLNTERCSVSLLIQSECRKMRTRIIPYTDTFYVVSVSVFISFLCFSFNWTRPSSLIFGTFWNFMNEVSSLTTEWIWWKFDFHTIGRPLDLTDAFAQISYQERRFI